LRFAAASVTFQKRYRTRSLMVYNTAKSGVIEAHLHVSLHVSEPINPKNTYNFLCFSICSVAGSATNQYPLKPANSAGFSFVQNLKFAISDQSVQPL